MKCVVIVSFIKNRPRERAVLLSEMYFYTTKEPSTESDLDFFDFVVFARLMPVLKILKKLLLVNESRNFDLFDISPFYL